MREGGREGGSEGVREGVFYTVTRDNAFWQENVSSCLKIRHAVGFTCQYIISWVEVDHKLSVLASCVPCIYCGVVAGYILDS